MAVRKCVACSRRRPKREMIRIGQSPWTVTRGEVKLTGRGAYLCEEEACLKAALECGRLDRALRARVPDSVYEEIGLRIKESQKIGENHQGP